MRIYYLYEKSAKKCHDLDEVVASLKECFAPTELPQQGGNRPLRACGTRFVSHKVAAIGCVLDRFGAYIGHLTELIEDSSTKAADKQKLRGYVKKWCDSRVILGCALFHDILKPSANLCKVLQEDEICVLSAIEAIIKTCKAIDSTKTKPFEDLPTVKKVLTRVHMTENGATVYTYQGATLTRYTEGLAYMKLHKNDYADSVVACLVSRLKVQHIDLLTDILSILATQGWEKEKNADHARAALPRLIKRFEIPLQRAGADLSVLEEEWEDMTDYGKRYLNLVQDDYHSIWWKLFNAADASKWVNILSLIELLFCLPVANGRVERMFSNLKIIKTDRRSSLSEDSLDHLVRIAVDGLPLSQWDAKPAVNLWWKSKQWREVHDTRTKPRPSTSCETEDSASTASEKYNLDLEDWDSLINN